MSEHTSGPWEAAPRSIMSGADGTVVLTTLKDMTKADCRLIASAPDLLAALETSPCPHPARDGIYTVKDCIEIGDCGCDNRAAIAKATGKGERSMGEDWDFKSTQWLAKAADRLESINHQAFDWQARLGLMIVLGVIAAFLYAHWHLS